MTRELLLAPLLIVVDEAGSLRTCVISTLHVVGITTGTYRAVVTLDVLRLLELAEDVLRKDLAELDTHLVYIERIISYMRLTKEICAYHKS